MKAEFTMDGIVDSITIKRGSPINDPTLNRLIDAVEALEDEGCLIALLIGIKQEQNESTDKR